MSEHPLANDPPRPPRGADLPYSDGEPMESKRHVDQMTLLIQTFVDAWSDREDFYCAGNMFLYYSQAQSKKNDFRGPDFFVVLDTDRRKPRKSWVIWEEDGRAPSVVIELLSPSTEAVDRGEKMRIYGRAMRVPYCYLYDPFTYVLEGYQLDANGNYTRMEPDARGFVACPALRLWLGVTEGRYCGDTNLWLRCFDDAGDPLPTGAESAAAQKKLNERAAHNLQQAERRAAEERQRAEEERQRAEEERQRAVEERHRADDAERRAREAEQRAEALAARLAQVESGSST